MRKETFFEIKGFDENYLLPAHEDQDLYLRLKSITAIPFAANAIVFHPVRRRSLKSVLGEIPRRCEAWAYHLNKNLKRLGYGSLFAALTVNFIGHGKSVAKNTLAWRWKSAVYHLALLTYGIPLVTILALRLRYLSREEHDQ